MKRRVVVVEGPLVFRMGRLRAARDGDLGLEIFTIPQLAAPLAGGFCRPTDEEVLYPAISHALGEGHLNELGSVAEMPGMVRAITQTLGRVWRADLTLRRWLISHLGSAISPLFSVGFVQRCQPDRSFHLTSEMRPSVE